jgi:hypothetical protein
MIQRYLPLALLSLTLAACSTVGQLTVKDYKATTGQRVVAGQAEPKAEYDCRKIATEKEKWGLSGNMDKAEASKRVTATAVDKAPRKGANYAYVDTPAQVGIGSLNVNAFSDADVTYYACRNLPIAMK